MRRALPALLALCACSDEKVLVAPDWDLNRMIEQPRYDAYDAGPFFPDGSVLQAPPPGTVPVDAVTGPPELVTGAGASGWATAIPLPLDRALLDEGRHRFEIVCATCHGVTGDGESEVAVAMRLVRPPSLLDDRVRSMPAGRIYAVVARGYGLMPSYGYMLDVRQRWAVIAYLRALQLSQRARLAELPPGLQRRAQEALR